MSLKKIILNIALVITMAASSGQALAAENKPAAAATVKAASTVTAEELFKISPDDMVQGDKKAKVTVIEYASMTCSHCADFYKNTHPQIKEKYIDTGKILFVFRPFPLDEPALRGSMLAYCSGADYYSKVDKFFKFTDVMFSTQANWAYAKNYLEVLANIGKLGGISGAEFDKCMADTELEKRIMQDKFNATTVLAVRATPTIFINGNIYKGAHSFDYFSKALDEALGEKPQAKESDAAGNKPAAAETK